MRNINGKRYKLIYLDTNILSDISKNYRNCGKNFLKYLLSNNYAPVTSVYNLYELNKSKEEYKNYIKSVFNKVPLLICSTFPQIITNEINGEDFILFGTGIEPVFNVQISTLFDMIDQMKLEIDKFHNNMIKDKIKWNELKRNSHINIFSIELLKDSYSVYDKHDTNISYIQSAKSSQIFSFIKYHFIFNKKDSIDKNSIIDTYNASIAPFVDEYVGEKSIIAWLDMSKDKYNFMKEKKFIRVSNFYD